MSKAVMSALLLSTQEVVGVVGQLCSISQLLTEVIVFIWTIIHFTLVHINFPLRPRITLSL